mmetsp:Transcript_1974/g.3620  ORF Transcript_1974/g.3620 Transcript_1974/m.3620 type:complete len:459 (+) Transcript_1974:227-1603(+)
MDFNPHACHPSGSTFKCINMALACKATQFAHWHTGVRYWILDSRCNRSNFHLQCLTSTKRLLDVFTQPFARQHVSGEPRREKNVHARPHSHHAHIPARHERQSGRGAQERSRHDDRQVRERSQADAHPVRKRRHRTLRLRQHRERHQGRHRPTHGRIGDQRSRDGGRAKDDAGQCRGRYSEDGAHAVERFDELGHAVLAIFHVARDQGLGGDRHGFGEEAEEPPDLQCHLVRCQRRLSAEGGGSRHHRVGEHETDRSREQHHRHVHKGFDDALRWQASPHQCHVSQWLGRCLDTLVQSRRRDGIVQRCSNLSRDGCGGGARRAPSLVQREPHVADQIDDARRAEYFQRPPRIAPAETRTLQHRRQKDERKTGRANEEVRPGSIQQRRIRCRNAGQFQQRIGEFDQEGRHDGSEDERQSGGVAHDSLVEVDAPVRLVRVIGIVDAFGRIARDEIRGRGR